jgi:GrpB-like predicted nucleotidyltransferase (UPF0157 family)
MSRARHPSLDERFDPAIRIVEHDPDWAPRAAAELARIGAALGPAAVRLEHVGSTAVPGLASKPIVDLQVSVAALDERYVAPLEALGYLFAPAPEESPDRHFFARPPARPRAFHVHVCAAGGTVERSHLAVRDYLRAHPEDRIAYIDGKHDHVAALERRALAWAAATGR